MAPRTRSKHHAQLLQEREELLGSGRANTQGFPALPAELHLEIISYFPNIPVPTPRSESEEANDIDGPRTRRSTLLALSQTCRALRRIFLGQLWQRIEVFEGITNRRRPGETIWGGPANYYARKLKHNTRNNLKLYAKELIRQLDVVTSRQPALAQYVRVVDILITDDFATEIASKVAKAFSILPHLHTVQLDMVILKEDNIHTFSSGFNNYQYPQIRTLSLPWEANFFLAQCPGVRVLVPYLDHCYFELPEKIQNLEVLGVTHLTAELLLPPNLRDISVILTEFEVLRLLPHLHTIRLRLDIEARTLVRVYPLGPIGQDEVDERVRYAHQILSEKEGDNSLKRVIVTYVDGRMETLSV